MYLRERGSSFTVYPAAFCLDVVRSSRFPWLVCLRAVEPGANVHCCCAQMQQERPHAELVIYNMCGEVVACLAEHDLSAIMEAYGNSTEALKLFLMRTLGLSKFRQHLIHENKVVQDADVLSALSLPASLQLVILPFLPATYDDRMQMQSAAEKDNVADMQQLLERRVDPDLKMNTGRGRALHIATTFDSLRCVSCLLQAGAKSSSLDEDGRSALWHAAAMGNSGIARVLLEGGARMDAASNGGEYPLCVACRRGHLDVVQVLLETEPLLQHMHPNLVEDVGSTQALHVVAKLGDTRCLRILLQAKADVQAKDEDGKSVLWNAAEIGRTDIVRLLLEAGANKDSMGDHPLSGHWDVVQYLIQDRADVDRSDVTGTSVVWEAARLGDAGIVRLLVEAAASPTINRTSDSHIPSTWASQASSPCCGEMDQGSRTQRSSTASTASTSASFGWDSPLSPWPWTHTLTG